MPILRKADDIHGQKRLAAHCIDIAQRIGDGNLTEQIRIVDHGGKEIEGEDQSEIVAYAVHPCIIRLVHAHEKIRVFHDRQYSHCLVQNLRTELAGSTGTVNHGRQLCLFIHSDFLLSCSLL
jgi:hypothetical protein